MQMASNHQFSVTPTLKNNKIEWEMCRIVGGQKKDCGKGDGNYPNVTLAKGSGAATFQVRIDDPATPTLGIKFSATDPVVIKKGEPFCAGKEKQIDPPKTGGGTIVTIVDKNSLPDKDCPAAVSISYGLRFVGPDGHAVTAIDPIIDNGGTNIYVPPGGSGGFWAGGSFADALPTLGLGLVVGVILTLLVQRFRK
jgi:hypothetical protein